MYYPGRQALMPLTKKEGIAMGIKSKLISALAISAIATSVFAGGPEPAAAPCNPFDGAYVGVAGGWTWFEAQGRLREYTPAGAILQNFRVSQSDNEFGIGGVVGFGRVWENSWYTGLEVHGTWHDLSARRNIAIVPAPLVVTPRVQHEWDWGVDFMPGYVWNSNVLLFGKIGYRGGDADFNFRVNTVPAFVSATRTRYLNGFNLGAGIKYNIWENLSAWVEYDYTWYDSEGQNVFLPCSRNNFPSQC